MATRITPPSTPHPPAGALAETVQVDGGASLGARAVQPPTVHVTLDQAAVPNTSDQALWVAIRNRTDAIGFDRYSAFIQRLLCAPSDTGAASCGGGTGIDGTPLDAADIGSPSIEAQVQDLASRPSIYGVDAYQLLKLATQAFLLFEGGVGIDPPRFGTPGNPQAPEQDEIPGEASRLGRPVTYAQARNELNEYLKTEIGTVGGKGLLYLKRIVDALIPVDQRDAGSPFCERTLRNRLRCPALIELIFCYWLEQGYLVQTLNAVALRFQNSRRGSNDPLANLALDPIRPLTNLLWGYVQDRDRLSVARRSLEYLYAYGLELDGKAVAGLHPVESRANFLEAFHNLLYRAAEFYRADAITTVRADGFPLLQALKEVHLVMAEGDNNQVDELKRSARIEMLTMQWLLARPEMREFLRGRVMVPYREAWMGQVDTMKRLQGGPQASITHFRELADSGEKILLAVRYGDWIAVNDQSQALNWARYWKPEIQAYLHAYYAVAGVDLAAEMTDTQRSHDRYLQPAAHLRQRLFAPAPRMPTAALAFDDELAAAPLDYTRAATGARALPRPRRGI